VGIYTYVSRNEDETDRLAQMLAEIAVPGTVIALDGELGAGKTRFSQAFAASLGVSAIVNSPTFTIIKEYEGGRLPFYHMDVYRITLEEADELGLDEYFYESGATLVEWARRIEPILPNERLQMIIDYEGDGERTITLIPYGSPYADWCSKWKRGGIIR
jgi:tRNA threonylcarbamoyladenosine biosynthesis protein TsaE